MNRPRTTIAGLIVLVTFVAVALAALRAADDAWDAGTFGLTLLILLVSILLAVHRRGHRRAYWLGFALFGWAYLILSLMPPAEARLPTTRLLARLDHLLGARPWWNALARAIDQGQPSWALPSDRTVAFSPQGGILMATSHGSVRLWDATTGSPLAMRSGTTEHFVRIGHTLLALMLAVLGGWLSRGLYDGGGRVSDHGPDAPVPMAARAESS